MNKSMERFRRISVVASMLVVATASYAFENENPENYVELGKMKSKSSFQILAPSRVAENFVIPVYKKSDYKQQALRGVTTPKNQVRKPSKKEISKLARRLRRMTIIPVPKYNFGREEILKSNKIGWSSSNYQALNSFSLRKKKVPNLLKGLKKKLDINLTKANKKNINFKKVDQKVILQSEVDAIQLTAVNNFEFKLKPMFLREPKDHDLLAADILFMEKNSCEEVVPISQYLHDKKTKDNRVKYYRGTCLHDSKMFSESIPLLAEVIGTSTDYYARKAVDKILSGLPKGYEGVIAKGLAPKNVYNKLEQKQKDKYNYILAKGNFVNEKYKRAEGHSKLVSKSFEFKDDARFIEGTSQYMSGKLQSGIKTMASLQADYAKRVSKDPEFRSLIDITLARFQFERGAYKSAIKNYEAISRDHPLWVDSLIEKGWAQIKLGDYAGAIGNMFTLHSPFFKDAFIPESYVIRTIGYLNLCQFGDANSTLAYLETEYPEQKRKIANFIGKKDSHYKTLLGYLSADTKKIYEYKGLPTSVVREMGRDRDYLVVQTKLNNIVDEIPMFKNFAGKVLGKRRNLKAEIAKLTAESKELRVKEGTALKNNEIELAKSIKKKRKSVFDEGFSLNYRIGLFDKGIIEYKKANGNAVKRAEKMRDEFIVEAESTLEESMANVDNRLETVLTNNDLLRYEVYANSGKNIRFRVAGGSTQETTEDRKPAAKRSKKDYNWKFKGEFWQDEIGNFKSDLVNLCPKR